LRWIKAKRFKKHPPQSLNLTWIEQAWAYLKSVVVHKAPKFEQTFYAEMQQALKELDGTIWKSCVPEFPDVMEEVHAKSFVPLQNSMFSDMHFKRCYCS
jgi:hypothetical protein